MHEIRGPEILKSAYVSWTEKSRESKVGSSVTKVGYKVGSSVTKLGQRIILILTVSPLISGHLNNKNQKPNQCKIVGTKKQKKTKTGQNPKAL